MGIYSRDYIRERRPVEGFGGASGLWAIKFLLIANIAVFVLQNLPGALGNGVTEWLSLSLSDLKSFQIWRVVTYGFCHSPSITHIFFNLFVLWMFGRAIEPIYGSREFLALFLTGVVVSGLCHVGVQAIQHSSVGVVGASGGVMTVVFLTAMHFPRMRVLLFFVLPIELRWLAVLYAVADVAGFLQAESSVAHAAHLGGAAFGVAYRYYNWQIMPLLGRIGSVSKFRLPKSRPKVRVYRPPSENLEKQVDEILAKIHKNGEASLTDRERKILKDASRQYRNRL